MAGTAHIKTQIALLAFPRALRAKAVEDEFRTFDEETVRTGDGGEGLVFEAEGAPAALAVEMDVAVGVFFRLGAMANFVAYAAAVGQGVQQVVLPESCQGPGDDGLVHGLQRRLDLGQRQRPPRLEQGLQDQDAVRGRLDAVLLHQCDGGLFVVVHTLQR